MTEYCTEYKETDTIFVTCVQYAKGKNIIEWTNYDNNFKEIWSGDMVGWKYKLENDDGTWLKCECHYSVIKGVVMRVTSDSEVSMNTILVSMRLAL